MLMVPKKAVAFAHLAESVQRDPMRDWYDVSWVRLERVEYTLTEQASDHVLFSPDLVPPVKHPFIVERGPEFAAEMLTHRFYTYADFTSVLEREAINVVTRDLARRIFWTELPRHMYLGAGRIYTDEAFHAQESDEVITGIVESTQIEPHFLSRPRFLSNLDLLTSNLDSVRRRLAMCGFAIVSETLISAILADIPHDQCVAAAVREFVAEHGRDEGRHHAYFSELLSLGWPVLPPSDREFLGPLFAKFVRWFLDPDLAWLRAFLAAKGFRGGQIEQILGDSYPALQVSATVREAARHSLARFAEVGVLQDNVTIEAFHAEGLLI
jgi:P-aminobenzoate N-oxygenase AurF